MTRYLFLLFLLEYWDKNLFFSKFKIELRNQAAI